MWDEFRKEVNLPKILFLFIKLIASIMAKHAYIGTGSVWWANVSQCAAQKLIRLLLVIAVDNALMADCLDKLYLVHCAQTSMCLQCKPHAGASIKSDMISHLNQNLWISTCIIGCSSFWIRIDQFYIQRGTFTYGFHLPLDRSFWCFEFQSLKFD